MPHHAVNGHVIGIHRRSCNLLCGSLPEQSRIITLADPAVGNGPFSILVDDIETLLKSILPNQPVQISNQQITINQWNITLSGAERWQSQLPHGLPRSLPSLLTKQEIAAMMTPYRQWQLDEWNLSMNKSTSTALQLAADEFITALVADNGESIATSTERLAGLGVGLTPSGDDFLVGAMAALWIHQRTDHLALIAQHATGRTTALSAAFVRAASHGCFVEPWHRLASALHAGNTTNLTRAMAEIAQIGASSGRDALAGFVAVYPLFGSTVA